MIAGPQLFLTCCRYNIPMLTPETFAQLLTPLGQQALAAAVALAPSDATLLPVLERLRREFPPDLAAAALETVRLRQRARAKFSRASQMYFTREALEQSSGELVARERAARYQAAGGAVLDVCCSIGGDALGLAEAGLAVHGLDRDPLRLALAEANAAVYGVRDRTRFELADALSYAVPAGALVFFDPARRSGQSANRRRVWRPDDYEPPLSLIERWLAQVAGLGVKVAPGIDYEALPYDCEVEIVSLAGEVKEACLWFGALRRHSRSATLITAAGQSVTLAAAAVPPVPAGPPLRYLYEPDGAVIRAHLVEQLAQEIGARKIDDEIAFLTSDVSVATPFARAFEVQEVLPFSLKRLRARLRELGVGQVVIKKRGSPLDPQALEQQLRLPERTVAPNQLTLVLTRVQNQPSVILCTPLDPARSM